jgi:MFS family permease
VEVTIDSLDAANLVRIGALEDAIRNEPTIDAASEPSPFRGISRNVLLLSIVSLLNDIASEMVYPLVPLFLAGALGAPASIIGVIEGLAEATASVFKWIFGAVSDRLGRRKPFCVAGYGLSSFTKPLLAIAGGWPLVLCARVADRFGKGLRTGARDALIADSTTPELRGRAFGFHRSGDSIGAVLGPLLAVVLISTLQGNYRTAFWLAFVPGLVGTLFVLPVRERPAAPRVRPLFSFAAFANPPLRRFLIITLFFTLGNSSDMFLILRARQLGATATTAVLLYAACQFVNALSSFPAGILSDRIGRKGILVGGFFLFGAVYFGFGMATSVGAMWALFGAYGFYLALTDGVSKALIVDLVDSDDRASALGMQAALTGIGAFPASLVAGLLWQRVGPGAAFLYGAATATVAAFWLLGSRLRRVD